MKEFNLSEKDRILIPESKGESFYWRKEKDIKTFIKKLKEILSGDYRSINCIYLKGEIDKLAGDSFK